MSEKIETLCAELSLTAVANHYATYADEAAKKKRSFVEYLSRCWRPRPRYALSAAARC